MDTLLVRLLLLAGLPIVISALSGLLIYRLHVAPLVEQGAIDELDAANLTAGALVEAWLDEQMRVVDYLASRPEARSWNTERMLEEGRGLAGAFADIVAVVFADTEGAVVADSLQTSGSRGSVADRHFFHEALMSGHAVSDVILARTSGLPIVTVAASVIGPAGAPLGVAFAAVRPEILGRILTPAPYPGVIVSFIVDAHNVVLAGPDAGTPLDGASLPSGSDAPYVNAAGTPVFGRIRPIDDSGWRIVSEMPVAAVTESFEAYNGLLLGSLTVTLVVAAAIATLLAMSIARPLARLSRLSAALGDGAPAPDGGGDALGHAPYELRSLRDRLITMAETIQVRRAELMTTNSLLEATQEIARVGSWEYRREPRSVWCSAQLARMLGIGTQARSIDPRTVIMTGEPDERARFLARFRESIAAGEAGFELEHRLRPLDGGAAMVVLHRVVHLRDPDGRVVRSRGTMLDITAGHEMEASLRAALADKSMLLQEVQHRVRNNLSVVEGILSLQRGQLPADSPAAPILTDSQSRVAAMAILHRQLYESDHVSEIDLADYVDALVGSLRESYGSSGITLTTSVDPIAIGIDSAFPCGLILNELVVNAYKHAFADGRGIIQVTGRRSHDTTYELSVADDGTGSLPGPNAGLGLELTTRLAGQLGGTLEIVRGSGTRAAVRFPVPEPV